MPSTAASVLLVEDQRAVRDMLLNVLQGEGFQVTAVETGELGLQALDRELFDLVLLDVNLPGISGMDVLEAARALQMDAQFILLTGFGSVDMAVEAMKLGAFDYLNKPVQIPELLVVLQRALRDRELRREVAQLRRRAGDAAIRSSMIGRSAPMRRLFDLMERVAPTRATVLITGETGTGKELVARGIHALSDRARRPFVPVNCGALPEGLLESELFGHVKGAFTGAVAHKRGLVEEARDGTLFLDEIATITPATQAKLLRVLQERKVQRVGSTQPTPVDFRLVAACNVDLAAEVTAGRFREDLFYRLNVFPIHVPPLRERREDIPLLAHHFRNRFAEENGVDAPEITPETLGRMTSYGWPGNVRELEHYLERAVILHTGARTLPFEPPRAPGAVGQHVLVEQAAAHEWDLARLEREYILATLERTQGHQGNAAAILGVDARTLSRKLKQYREDGVIPSPV